MRGRSGLVLGARRRSEGREKSGTASQFASGRALFFKGHTGGRIGGSPHFSLPCDFCHGLLGAVRRFALLLLAATSAYPHDIWLVPDRSSLSKGDTLVVRQVVGSELEVEMELEVLRRMTPRFELITRSGSVDLMKELPDMRTRPVVKPVFERKLDFEGPALLAMDHAFIHGAFSREKFLEYLEHEDLELEEFRPHLGNRAEQSERYARTLKCLFQVGEAGSEDLHKKVLGQRLEILLQQNPYTLKPGEELDVKVLFDGKPASDQLVTAFNGDGDQLIATSKQRTDSRGIARFTLERAGFWLVRLVLLQPCSAAPDVDCSDIDWQSYWSAYSFRLD